MAAQTRVQVVLNSEGVKALLNSEGVSGACRSAAIKIRERAGKGYRLAGPYHPGSRVVYRVYCNTVGRQREAREKSLTKALKSSRIRGGKS